ncbi:MAG: acetylglutamate kinase [Armatimonadota bacterium]
MKRKAEQAEVLVHALPYIRKYSGKTVVIKYGGNAMTDEALKEMVMNDVVLLHYVGMRPVVVHGGGPDVSEMMARLGKEPSFVGGLRVTDAETMEIAEMVLAGKTNKNIVSLIHRRGGKAVGLSGKDGNLLVARQMDEKLGYVGEITEINTEIVEILIREGYVPVISSVAVGPDGQSYNTNADHAAGAIAAALSAEKLILLTDVPGIYRDFADKSSLISALPVSEAEGLIGSGKIGSGMIPKVEACITALAGGVGKTHIIDGTVPHALLMEVFTDEGIGTMIVSSG